MANSNRNKNKRLMTVQHIVDLNFVAKTEDEIFPITLRDKN